jgi:activator of HSP90 ATPase
MKLELTTLKQKVILTASPEAIYEAFTDPRKHTEFTGSKATGKVKVCGKFTAWDGYIFGRYLEFEKGKRLVQEWQTTEWPDGYPPSKFELTFNPVPEGTEVSMVHSDIPLEQKDELADGWKDFYWKPLKKYFKK